MLSLLPPTCAWDDPNASHICTLAAYTGDYPLCALHQWDNHQPIACQGIVGGSACDYASGTPQPTPASWHVHVFFPNKRCTNCSAIFTHERLGFSFAGSMAYRGMLASQLNALTLALTGQPPRDPIDADRAAQDPTYNQCASYQIVAGAPANYHPEPCAFEVDTVKRGGPFTDPESGLGYPNWSFLLPGAAWIPGLVSGLERWLAEQRAAHGYGEYDVLIHPNSGCEVRDHMEPRSLTWLGTARPLLASIFSCRALGCNQACQGAKLPLAPPANCSTHQAATT